MEISDARKSPDMAFSHITLCFQPSSEAGSRESKYGSLTEAAGTSSMVMVFRPFYSIIGWLPLLIICPYLALENFVHSGRRQMGIHNTSLSHLNLINSVSPLKTGSDGSVTRCLTPDVLTTFFPKHFANIIKTTVLDANSFCKLVCIGHASEMQSRTDLIAVIHT